MMRNTILLLALFCAACSSYSPKLPSIRPYHMDIQQGNVITPKMMMQLKPGMTKAQVRYVMGTPLITDSFHPNRWDYFYSMKKNGRMIEQRRVILEFENDQLARVRGDVIPAGSDASATAQAKPQSEQSQSGSATQSKPAAPKQEKGWLDRLKFWGGDKKPEQTQDTKPAPAPAPQPAKVEEPKPAPVQQPVAEPQPQPKAAAAPEGEKKGLLDRLKFWGDDKKEEPKAPNAAPATKVEESKPEAPPAKPAPVAEPVQPKPVAKPDVPLPPEDDPTFFERMLEKIGF